MPATLRLPAIRPTLRQALVALTLVGLVVRAPRLAGLPLQWDEGWSIALAALPAVEMLDLTARDVHPPLYYALLASWLGALGASPWAARALSVLVAAVATPLAAAAAASWWPGARRGRAMRVAAAYAALAPPLVYYAGIARMYALTAPLLLLAAYGVGRLVHRPPVAQGAPGARRWRTDWRGLGAAALGASAALLAFYYAGFALAGLGAAALLGWPRRWRAVAAWAAATALAAAPWLAYAAPLLAVRIGARTGGTLDLARVPAGMLTALHGALAVDADARPALAAVFVAGAAALALGRDRRGVAVVAVPVLAVAAGAALGAQAHMLAPRYAIVATPFVALFAGWVAREVAGRGRLVAAAALAALVAGVGPTLTGAAHERSAEVDAPYDAAALPAAVGEVAAADDLVVFNLLSLAGAYHALRPPGAAPWTYAQLWDPVHEPPERAVARLAARLEPGSPGSDPSLGPRIPGASGAPGAGSAAPGAAPRAAWLVLYRGLAAEDTAALARWADWQLWPFAERWVGDVLLRGYVDAEPDRTVPLAAPAAGGPTFEGGVGLVAAAHSGAARAGRGLAVELAWSATRPVTADLRVFVHAYGPDGALVAQHDGVPQMGTRPAATWAQSERIVDRHGLLLPADAPAEVALTAGLYDAASSRRLALPDGRDAVELGRVGVHAPSPEEGAAGP